MEDRAFYLPFLGFISLGRSVEDAGGPQPHDAEKKQYKHGHVCGGVRASQLKNEGLLFYFQKKSNTPRQRNCYILRFR